MSAKQKDKRTKEQIMQLLEHAMEQEDRLSEKIKSLETELTECRKKAEDPRHELTEEALPASKVSFRIDYYKTEEIGPIKGIIEHLPSRKNKAFEGEGQTVISDFMNRFLIEEAGGIKKQKEKKAAPAATEEPVGESRLMHKVKAGIAAESGEEGNGSATVVTSRLVVPPPQEQAQVPAQSGSSEAADTPKPAAKRSAAQHGPRRSLLERVQEAYHNDLL